MDPHTELNEQEFLEMASLTGRSTGIEGVVIWAGPNPHGATLRIKISNTYDYRGNDLFTLSLPDYQVLGRVNEQRIDTAILDKIKRWCSQNMLALQDYAAYKTSTDEFLQQLMPLKEKY